MPTDSNITAVISEEAITANLVTDQSITARLVTEQVITANIHLGGSSSSSSGNSFFPNGW